LEEIFKIKNRVDEITNLLSDYSLEDSSMVTALIEELSNMKDNLNSIKKKHEKNSN